MSWVRMLTEKFSRCRPHCICEESQGNFGMGVSYVKMLDLEDRFTYRVPEYECEHCHARVPFHLAEAYSALHSPQPQEPDPEILDA